MLQFRRPGWQKHKVAAEGKGLAPAIAAVWGSLWSIAEIDSRPLLLGFSLCGGVIVYFSLSNEPLIWPCLLATIGAGFFYVATRWIWWMSVISLPALVLLGLIGGFTAATIRTASVEAPVISSEMRPLMLEGWVREVETGAKGNRLRIEVHALSGVSAEETPKYVRVTHRLDLQVAPGRFVRCFVLLRPPPSPSLPGDYDFRRQAWFEQLGGVGYVMGRCRGGALGAPDSRVKQMGLDVAAFRRRLAEHVNEAAGARAGGFAAALISGDRSFMKIEDQEALRASGLSHLLAISGLHMAMVGGLVFLLVRRVLAFIEPLALRIAVQKPAAIAALTASFVYLVISGASVSTQRAFIMSAVVFGAVLADRAALSLRSYAIAMILVVLLQPESVMTPGFQMSFAASGALIATYDAWSRRRAEQERILGSVSFSWASLFVTSLVAGAATAPFAIYHFDRLAGFGLLANLLAMPIISFVSAPLAALALILTPFGLGDTGLRLFGLSLEAVLAVAHWCSSLPNAAYTLPRTMPAVTLVLSSCAIASAMAARGSARVLLSVLLIIPAAVLWARSHDVVVHWAPSGDVFLRNKDGKVVRFEMVDGDGLSPLRYSTAETEVPCDAPACTYPVTGSGITEGTATLYKGRDDSEPAIDLHLDEHHLRLNWDDVVTTGGITIKSGRDGPKRLNAPICGRRPWRACN
ncbi:ComEC/Rec2 family competence protein [Hyphomonas jannaschiana]|uniref:ComEC/Rec2-like protein n=1 Tax=Hyphomonas jannaschiana VP2 TaxID=1280952 RepID=A0A059FAV8_9PROT|nr:ComEC/Rec2 family competence protein [Hyphomonas jannaschiana]KCZ87749.1 ComEC/Rec2-like protein [Hyphomonas jannaschiana VP2]